MKLYLRVAFSSIIVIEAKEYSLFRLIESITWSSEELEGQVRLTFQLTSNNFASLKYNK